ncbi:MAG: pentapeptide repeat-containing protein [Candidatus Bathyarchaeota archaeon]|nr:pentapeptide repeat-containing protein [Candidatus Termiticorpusculum sp.]
MALTDAVTWKKYQSSLLKNDGSRIIFPYLKSYRGTFSGYSFFKCDFQGVSLKLTNLYRCEFRECTFFKCDFQGVSLKLTNLYRCEFRECTFSHCLFEHAILVGAKLVDCKMTDSEVNDVVVRNADVSGCKIEKPTFKNIEFNLLNLQKTDISAGKISLLRGKQVAISLGSFEHIEFESIKIEGIAHEDVKLAGDENKSCNVCNLIIKDCSFFDLSLNKTKFTDCEFTDVDVITGIFDDSNAYTCEITRFNKNIIQKNNWYSLSFTKCNIVSGILTDVDLEGLQINKIGLLDSWFIDCTWPEQDYKITCWGEYKRANNLLCQPVEDIKGIDPKKRAEIRQAQLADKRYNEARENPIKRLLMWLWAITSAYGRSLGRLTTSCGFAIVTLWALYLLFSIPGPYWQTSELWISGWPSWTYLSSSLWYITRTFIGIGALPTANGLQEALLVITRIVGIVFLGLWVAFVANKLLSK